MTKGQLKPPHYLLHGDETASQKNNDMNGTTTPPSARGADTEIPRTGSDLLAAAVMRRYQDAYLVARANIFIGRLVRTAGLAIGVLMLVGGILVGIASGKSIGRGPEMAALTYVATVAGACIAGVTIGLPLVMLGTLVSAQGQVLRATLDMAVNTSPFLDKEQVAQVISLK